MSFIRAARHKERDTVRSEDTSQLKLSSLRISCVSQTYTGSDFWLVFNSRR